MSEFGKEILQCELCGHNEAIEVPYIRHYTGGVPYHICKGCGLVYFKYRRTPEELAKYWEEEMFNKGNYVARNPYFKARHTYAAEFLDLHLGLSGKKIIDIGAGDGQFLEMVHKYGAEIQGVESSKRNHELMSKSGIYNYCGTIEDYYQNEILANGIAPNVDIATILWTLQNSQSATDMLEAAWACLNNNGHVFIQLGLRILTPYHKPIDTYFTNVPGDLEPYRFSIRTLNGFLSKCGFEVVMTNNYWDQDVLNLLAKKVDKPTSSNFLKDDWNSVINYILRWKNESDLMVEYMDILNLNYKFYDKQLFWKRKGLL